MLLIFLTTGLKSESRFIIQILINESNQVLFEGELIEFHDISAKLEDIYENCGKSPDFPEMKTVPFDGQLLLSQCQFSVLVIYDSLVQKSFLDSVSFQIDRTKDEQKMNFSLMKYNKQFEDLDTKTKSIVDQLFEQSVQFVTQKELSNRQVIKSKAIIKNE